LDNKVLLSVDSQHDGLKDEEVNVEDVVPVLLIFKSLKNWFNFI